MKKTIFYFYSSLSGSMLGVLLDEGRKMIESKESEVLFVMCEGFWDSCLANPKGNKGICKLCKNQTRKIITDALGDDVEIVRLSDYYRDTVSTELDDFENSQQLKDFTYKGIKIGFSVLSSYIHITRNHKPKVDANSNKYFKQQCIESMKLVDAFSNILDEFQPTCVASFNGRFSEIRPVFEITKLTGIEAVLYEFERLGNDMFAKVKFKNVLPHSVKGNRWKFDYIWNDKNLKEGENVKIAKEFFSNKRNGIAAGDKVYIKGTPSGSFPKDWDSSKRNILFFNSSEDEYVSIGEEWTELSLFSQQIEGLKSTLEKFKDSAEFDFYLRIHPNFTGIKYKYHTELYELEKKYENFTIYKPDEKVNSYDLIDHCEKVIVFGSTVGLESAYAGKPVILLSCSWYYYEEICYIPKTKSEYFKMVQEYLEPIKSDNILKMGLFFYHRNSTYIDTNPPYRFINFNPVKYKVFKRTVIGYHYQKLLGSAKLRAFYVAFLKVLSFIFFSNKYTLPTEDE